MSSDIGIFTLLALITACVLSRTIASSTDRLSQNAILSLALLASTGVLLATSAIEMTGRYGHSVRSFQWRHAGNSWNHWPNIVELHTFSS